MAYKFSSGQPLSFVPTLTDSSTSVDAGLRNGRIWSDSFANVNKPVPAFFPSTGGIPVSAHSTALVTNPQATQKILVGPLKGGFEKHYADDTPMFVFKESRENNNNQHVVAPVPVINFWMEDAHRVGLLNVGNNPRIKRALERGDIAHVFGQNKPVIPSIGYDSTVPTHAESFCKKWAYHGVQRNVAGESHYEESGNDSTKPLSINYNHSGQQKCVNIFTLKPKPNSYVYFVVGKNQALGSMFYEPMGGVLGERTHGSFLQIRGFSSTDSGGCLVSDSTDDPNKILPDYTDANHILKRESSILEVDESDGRVYHREVEMVDIPDVVINAYRTGPVYRVGLIHMASGASITPEQYTSAHCTLSGMNRLPKMDLLLGL